MIKEAKILWHLYKRSLPKDPLRKRIFKVSQLILFTAVPGIIFLQSLGSYGEAVSISYLLVLLVIAYLDTHKLHREFIRQETAHKVAEKLRDDGNKDKRKRKG